MIPFVFSERQELLDDGASAVLYRNALSDEEASAAFRELESSVPWEQRSITVFGRRVPQPRLVAWFGDPGRNYRYSGDLLHSQEWTSGLRELRTICESLAGSKFNAVLLNLYRDGGDGVAWHADDESELGVDPVIGSLSLGATRRFDLRHRESGRTVSTDLPHASFLVMSGATQRDWMHQIPKTKRPVGPRINLTFRWIHDPAD